MSPLVSVCLPVFNGQKYLPAAIESVLKQSETDLELLISDDDSTDGSWEIIRRYSRADSRIRAWRNDINLGLFQNYNLCLSRARGRYIKTFAQDDLLEPDILRRCVTVLEKHPAVTLVAVARSFIDEGNHAVPDPGHAFSFDGYFPVEEPVSDEEIILKSLLPVTNFIGEPSTITFRKSDMADGFDCSLYHLGDLDFCLRLLNNGSIYYLPEPLCRFRLHTSARTNANTRNLLFALDQLRLGQKFADLLRSRSISEDEFLSANIDALARQIDYLNGLSTISVSDLRQQGDFIRTLYKLGDATASVRELERLIADLLNFRELAFLGLRAAGRASNKVEDLALRLLEAGPSAARIGLELLESSSMDRLPQIRAHVASVYNQRRIVELEARLRAVLSSLSWAVTRPIRELNRRRIQHHDLVEPTDLSQLERFQANSDLQDILHHQALYLRYLREQIARVKTSRSWKLTRPMRLFNRSNPK